MMINLLIIFQLTLIDNDGKCVSMQLWRSIFIYKEIDFSLGRCVKIIAILVSNYKKMEYFDT